MPAANRDKPRARRVHRIRERQASADHALPPRRHSGVARPADRQQRQHADAAVQGGSGGVGLARASNPQDEIFVLNFDDKARIDVPFTSDVAVLERRSPVSTRSAARRCATPLRWRRPIWASYGTRDRKVLLVITDGIDNASVGPATPVVEKAEQRDTVISPSACLVTRLASNRADKELDELADKTGGMAYTRRDIGQITPSHSKSRGRSGTCHLAVRAAESIARRTYRSIRVTVSGPER